MEEEGIQAQLIIKLLNNGQIQISGPIQNKLLVYGLLECARDAITEMAKEPPSLITPVRLTAKFGN